MDILLEDKNYGFYSCWLSGTHQAQAWALARLGRFGEAMEHLQTAADFAVEYDTRLHPEDGAYTSLLLRDQKYPPIMAVPKTLPWKCWRTYRANSMIPSGRQMPL